MVHQSMCSDGAGTQMPITKNIERQMSEIQAGSDVFYELTFSANGETYVVDGVERKANEIFFYSVSQCQAGETKIFQNFECGSDELNFAFYGKYKSGGQMRFRFSFTAWSDFDGQLVSLVSSG